MRLTKIEIQNFRLLQNVSYDVDEHLTVIVGRNNSGKTSCFSLLYKVISKSTLTYSDYPLTQRNKLRRCLYDLLHDKCNYEHFLSEVPITSVKFTVDYSSEKPEENLGVLAPFIIDLDPSVNTALIEARYEFKLIPEKLKELFQPIWDDGEDSDTNIQEREERDFDGESDQFKQMFNRLIEKHFTNLFDLKIRAISPLYSGADCNNEELYRQIKTSAELERLFPCYFITAERSLDESAENKKSSLSKLVEGYFKNKLDIYDDEAKKAIGLLRTEIEKSNNAIQDSVSEHMSKIVEKIAKFGYPGEDDLKVGASTRLQLDDQIANQTVLTYYPDRRSVDGSESPLPATHNGLGYKNLIKIIFQIISALEDYKQTGQKGIFLLFIEEPESHMHPQMQQKFVQYITSQIETIKKERGLDTTVQIIMSTHSVHIAHSVEFSKIRYVQKLLNSVVNGVIIKNMKEFKAQDETDKSFIQKFLTVSSCEIFFADKLILVEGASERLLIPDMIERLSSKENWVLHLQYYSLLTVGGCYAYKLIPLIKFLGIPCLIITDLDPVKALKSEANSKRNWTKCLVSEATSTSNATIKRWIKDMKKSTNSSEEVNKWISSVQGEKQPCIKEILNMPESCKSDGNIHIEFQLPDKLWCGRSFEEAIFSANVNFLVELKDHLHETEINEKDLAFEKVQLNGDDMSKTDFALWVLGHDSYEIPMYIIKGLSWLNSVGQLEKINERQ